MERYLLKVCDRLTLRKQKILEVIVFKLFVVDKIVTLKLLLY